MFPANKNNFIFIDEFIKELNCYEDEILNINTDQNALMNAALSLKKALDRAVHSSFIDAFQMLRILSKRMFLEKPNLYTDNLLLKVSDIATQVGGADIILTIVYGLKQVSRGINPSLDEIWFSITNGNIGVKAFFESFATSDILAIIPLPENNKVITVDSYIPQDYEDQFTIVRLGKNNLDVNLTAFFRQTVKFNVDTQLILPEDYDSSLPLFIKTNVKFKSGFGEFILDKTIQFTDSALSIVSLSDYIDKSIVMNGNSKFKFPNYFYTYEVEVVSYDSGNSWWVVNILTIPPIV